MRKLTYKSNLRSLGRVESKKMLPETIIHEISETNSSFHVKSRTTGKVQFLFFKRLLASNNKTFISGGVLNSRQKLYKVLTFS